MKRLTAFVLLLTLIFSFTACVAIEPVTDIKAFEEQVFDDYIEQYYPGKYPHERPLKFQRFYYLGSDKRCHIVYFLASEIQAGMTETVEIAGYEFSIGGSWNLMAYKKGKFMDLKEAYKKGWVSKEAIAKAADIMSRW